MKLCLLAASLLLSSAAISSTQEVRRALPAQSVEREFPRALPIQSLAANDVANFLAGVPVADESPLFALQKSKTYAAHVAALARLSQHFDRHYFSKMRSWSAAELAPRIPMNIPVYYFFGGPDAVSVIALFPDAPVYILGGLESVGSVPAPNALPQEQLALGLDNLRKSAEMILSYGHFITKDMKAELDRSAFRGVLPLIYTFIALAGGNVLSTQFIGISVRGVEEFGEGVSGSRNVLPGARVEFRGRGGRVQTLFYVQANVADDALRLNSALLKWAGTFGAGNVYLKAASYLLHEPYFSRIRSFLLDHAASVLQDDSGIPFRFFRDGSWRLWLFGTYSGTLDIFTEYHQGDLQATFAAPDAARPLPFGTGYKWRRGESNLLLAVKQQTLSPSAVGPH